MKHSRQYDLIVLGATGYTGRLTAEHVAAHLPSDLKWALAGRSQAKMQAVVDECSRLSPQMSRPQLEIVDVNDAQQIEALVRKTAVVITTVGPYFRYGEGVVRACAQSGTHYLDCTGETPWVARMIEKYDAAARQSGAIIVCQNGLESAAADLITWGMVRFLKAKLGAQAREVILSIHQANFVPSGGTVATILGIFDHFSVKELQAMRKPYVLSPVPHPEAAHPSSSLLRKLFGVRTVPDLGLQTTSLTEMVDGRIVERSWGLMSQIPSRKDQFYGPKFKWAQYLKPKSRLQGVVFHWTLIVGGIVLGLVPPVRTLAKRFFPDPGEGMGKEGMAKAETEYRGVAIPDTTEPSRKRAFCRAHFRGASYQLTALLLSQAAMTMLEDELELPGGMYTPACLGQGYLDRVNEAGFKIDIKLRED